MSDSCIPPVPPRDGVTDNGAGGGVGGLGKDDEVTGKGRGLEIAAGLGLFTGVAGRVWARGGGARGNGARRGGGIMVVRGEAGAGGGWCEVGPGAIVGPVEMPELVNVPRGFVVRNTMLWLDGGRGGERQGHAGAGVLATVEHLLAAAAGLWLWDITFVVEGPEVPIGDGSALGMVRALEAGVAAGVIGRAAPEPLVLRETIGVERGGASIVARPRREPGAKFIYHLKFAQGAGAGALQDDVASWETGGMGDAAGRERFIAEVALARTFSFAHEVEAARGAGMFKGFTARDLPVIGKDGRLIDNEWRGLGEPARHKLLDLVGDMALLGRPVQAEIEATASGHALAHELVRAIAGRCGEGRG